MNQSQLSSTRYEQLPSSALNNIIWDKIQTSLEEDFLNTVDTIFCNHPKVSYKATYDLALLQLRSINEFRCACGQSAQNESQLSKNLYAIIQEEFPKQTQEVQVISGILTHRYQRNKLYTSELESLVKQQDLKLIQGLKSRYSEQSSIYSLIQQSKDINKIGNVFSFWAFCLLDKVKLIIPVRIVGCQHVGCYELTSLLIKQKEQQGVFKCVNQDCKSELDLNNINTMISKLFIDLKLLKILNSFPSSQFKFNCDIQKKEFIKASQYDTYISEFKQKYPNNDKNLENYSIAIINQIETIFQQENDIKKLEQEKEQLTSVNMIDQFINKNIEIPVRCIQCKNLEKCLDLRTMICDFDYKNNQFPYNCPLCNAKLQSKQRGQKSLKGLIYIDFNMLELMQSDQQQLKKNVLEFFSINSLVQMIPKFSKEAFIQQLNNSTGYLETKFKNIFCIISNNIVENPILIKQCPNKSVVELDILFQLYKQNQKKITQEGIYLCNCDYCSQHPIKDVAQELQFQEFLAFALAQSPLKQIIQNERVLRFNFKTNKQIIQLKDYEQNKNMKKQNNQYKQIWQNNDQDVSQAFEVKQLQDGKEFQLLNLKYNIAENIEATINKRGLNLSIDDQIQYLNDSAQPELLAMGFRVTGMQIQMRNDIFKINKGKILSGQQQ